MKLKGTVIRDGFYVAQVDYLDQEDDGLTVVYVKSGYVSYIGIEEEEEYTHAKGRGLKLIRRIEL
jgi:hypothetical protein